jgi:hypothetical protein
LVRSRTADAMCRSFSRAECHRRRQSATALGGIGAADALKLDLWGVRIDLKTGEVMVSIDGR